MKKIIFIFMVVVITLNAQFSMRDRYLFNIDDNVTLGTLGSSITGTGNVYAGFHTPTLTSGNYNVFLGYQACRYGNPSYAIFIGYDSGIYSTVGNYSIGIGHSALKGHNTLGQTGIYNIAIGFQAGMSTTSGSANTFIGVLAGQVNTTGIRNVMLGYNTGAAAIASGNTFLGFSSGSTTTTGKYNIAIGHDQDLATTTTDSTFITGVTNGDPLLTGNMTVGVVNRGLTVDGDFSYELRHAHLYYTGESTAIDLTQNVWSHLSNATKNLFTVDEASYLTFEGDSLTIIDGGDYELHLSADGTAGTTGDLILIGLTKNSDTPLALGTPRDKAGANDAYVKHNWVWYLENLVAGDDLKVMVTNTADGDDYTPIDGVIYIKKVHD